MTPTHSPEPQAFQLFPQEKQALTSHGREVDAIRASVAAVYATTEDHRHACEVRWVAALPDREARREYLAKVAKHRGADARQRIVEGLQAMAQPVAVPDAPDPRQIAPEPRSTKSEALTRLRRSGALTGQQQRVLAAFAPKGTLTRQELSRRTGIPINAICGRVNELAERGLVVVATRRMCSVTGQRVEALSLTATEPQVELFAA